MTSKSLPLACILVAAAMSGWQTDAKAAEPATVATPAPADEGLPRLRHVRDDLWVSAQPALEAWRRLQAGGTTTVVNLRPDAELEGRDERTEVEAAGLAYHHIPVAGTDDLTQENASRLWTLLEAADGRVLAHCASGNRVGALLALGAAQKGGMSPADALAFGKSAGLASPALEAEVRVRLGLPAAAE